MTTRQSSAVPLPGRMEQVVHIQPNNQLSGYSVEKGSHVIDFTFPKIPGQKILAADGIRLRFTVSASTPSKYNNDADAMYGTDYPVYLSNIAGVHAMISRITLYSAANNIIETVGNYSRMIGSYFGSLVSEDHATYNLASTDACHAWLNDPHVVQYMGCQPLAPATTGTGGSTFYRYNEQLSTSTSFVQRNHLDFVNGKEFNILLQIGNNNNDIDLLLDQGLNLSIELNEIAESCYVQGLDTTAQKVALLRQCSIEIQDPQLEVTYSYSSPSNFSGMPGEAGSTGAIESTTLPVGEYRFASYAYTTNDLFSAYNDKQLRATQRNVKRYKIAFKDVGTSRGGKDPAFSPWASFRDIRFMVNQQPISYADDMNDLEVIKVGLESNGNWHGDLKRTTCMHSTKAEYGAVLATIGSGFEFNGPNAATIRFQDFAAPTYDSFVHNSLVCVSSDIAKERRSKLTFIIAANDIEYRSTEDYYSSAIGLNLNGANNSNQWGMETFMPGQAVAFVGDMGLQSSIV